MSTLAWAATPDLRQFSIARTSGHSKQILLYEEKNRQNQMRIPKLISKNYKNWRVVINDRLHYTVGPTYNLIFL